MQVATQLLHFLHGKHLMINSQEIWFLIEILLCIFRSDALHHYHHCFPIHNTDNLRNCITFCLLTNIGTIPLNMCPTNVDYIFNSSEVLDNQLFIICLRQFSSNFWHNFFTFPEMRCSLLFRYGLLSLNLPFVSDRWLRVKSLFFFFLLLCSVLTWFVLPLHCFIWC